jgi:hypothetical protein
MSDGAPELNFYCYEDRHAFYDMHNYDEEQRAAAEELHRFLWAPVIIPLAPRDEEPTRPPARPPSKLKNKPSQAICVQPELKESAKGVRKRGVDAQATRREL